MAILVRFVGDAASFLKESQKVGKSLKNTDKTLAENAKSFAKWGAGVAAAGAAVGAAMFENSADAAREIRNLSRVANTSVEEFQKMAFAAKTVGIEQDKLSDQLKDFVERIGDFTQTGAGPMKDFFEFIGPKVNVTAKSFQNLSGAQGLQLFYNSLEKANLSSEEMSFYLESMASDTTALVPLLANSGALLREHADAADTLGIVLSDLEVDKLATAAGEFSKVSKQVDILTDRMNAKLAPAIAEASRQLSEFIAKMSEDENSVGFLERRIGELQARLSQGFRGRSGKGLKQAVKTELEQLEAQLQTAKALTGDQSAAEKELARIQGELAEAGEKLNEVQGKRGRSSAGVRAGIRGEIADLETLKASIEEATTVKKQAAVVEEKGGTFAGGNNTFEDTQKGATQKAVDAEKLRQQARVNAVRDSLSTEKELEMQAHEEKMALLESAAGELFESEFERHILLEQEKLAHQQRMSDIEKSESDARIEQAKKEADAKSAAQKAFFTDLTALMSTGSKKAFQVGKAAAISNAVIDGWESATAAWASGMKAGGPPLAAAFTAASLAKTGAMIQSIKGQTFGTGSNLSTGTGVGAVATPAASAPAQQFDVSIERVGEGSFLSESAMDNIFENINERLSDGQQLRNIGFN